jgi:hypothetical protein
VQKGVKPSERGQLLPYLHREACKGFLYCNQSFIVEEVGFKAHEKSLWVRDSLLKKWVVMPVSILSR